MRQSSLFTALLQATRSFLLSFISQHVDFFITLCDNRTQFVRAVRSLLEKRQTNNMRLAGAASLQIARKDLTVLHLFYQIKIIKYNYLSRSRCSQNCTEDQTMKRSIHDSMIRRLEEIDVEERNRGGSRRKVAKYNYSVTL